MTRKKIAISFTAVALAALVVAGCGSSSSSSGGAYGGGGGESTAAATTTATAPQGAGVAVVSVSSVPKLGKIVVDSEGIHPL